MVPVSMRTPPVPVPYLRTASTAAVVDARIANQAQVVVGGQHHHLPSFGLDPGTGAAFQSELIRIDAGVAGPAHQLKHAPRAGINQVFLGERPVFIWGKEAVKKVP